MRSSALILVALCQLAAGFVVRTVPAIGVDSSTRLQARRDPIRMPTDTPMVPYRVS